MPRLPGQSGYCDARMSFIRRYSRRGWSAFRRRSRISLPRRSMGGAACASAPNAAGGHSGRTAAGLRCAASKTPTRRPTARLPAGGSPRAKDLSDVVGPGDPELFSVRGARLLGSTRDRAPLLGCWALHQPRYLDSHPIRRGSTVSPRVRMKDPHLSSPEGWRG